MTNRARRRGDLFVQQLDQLRTDPAYRDLSAVRKGDVFGLFPYNSYNQNFEAGVIGFVGLICPHIVRRGIGDDHRFVMPASCLTGAVLLLASDTVARLILSPHVLPVSILTAFLGAPTFLYLLIQERRH